MYLRGSKWTMTRRRRRPSAFRVTVLLVLISIGVYVNQVVVPAAPPLFMPTPTPTQSPESYVSQAEQFYAEGKLTQAVEAYQEAIAADPANPALYIALARLQVWTASYEEAVVNSQNALLKNPNNPLGHAVQGWALGMMGQYGEAEVELKKAINLDPNNALAYAYYAEVLAIQATENFELLEKAVDASHKARELDGSLMEVHRARGIVLYFTGADNREEAINEFQSALMINKNIADLHLWLGRVYRAAENYELAEESLLTAVSLNPQDPTGLTELSAVYFANGRYAQAAQYAEDAIQVQPENARLHALLGQAYFKSQEYQKAIPELALAIRGGDTADGVFVEGIPLDYDYRTIAYYSYYALALARTGRCAEAVPVAQAMITGVSTDETGVYNANEALRICQEGVESSPDAEDSQTTETEEPASDEAAGEEEPAPEATETP